MATTIRVVKKLLFTWLVDPLKIHFLHSKISIIPVFFAVFI